MLSHLLLVHNWIDVYARGIDGPLWSVATEWQIYFVLPFLLLPIWRRFGLAATVAAAFAVGLAPHFLSAPVGRFDKACPWYLGLFALGMAGALLSARRDLRLEALAGRIPWGVLTAACAAAVLVGRLRHPGADSEAANWYVDILCGLFAAVLLVWCSRRAQAGFWLTDTLQSRPAMALGAMSYSIYLIHMPLEQIIVLTLCSHHLPFRLLVPGTFLLAVPAVLGVCYLFHLLFERPFMPGKPHSERASEKAALMSPAP